MNKILYKHFLFFLFLQNMRPILARYNMTKLLGNIMEMVAPNQNFNCFSWTSLNYQLDEWFNMEYMQVINMENNNRFQKVKNSLEILHVRHSKTVMIIDDFERLLSVAKLTNNIHHMFVLIGSERPKKLNRLKVNTPLVWVPTLQNKVTDKVALFCPSIGHPRLPQSQQLATCSLEKGCLYLNTYKNVHNLCSNPFHGQTITFGAIPSLPEIMLPKYAGGRLSGYAVNLFLMYAKKFSFTPHVKVGTKRGQFFPNNRSFSDGFVRNLMTIQIDVASGGIGDIINSLFDMGPPLWHIEEKYITRKPQPLKPFFNIFRPFSVEVWVALSLSLAALSLTFLLFNKVYLAAKCLMPHNLTLREESTYLFFLYTFTKMSEPDPLPWFAKWSVGRLLSLVYYATSTILIMLYACNLKSYITTTHYETPPAGRYDLVALEKSLYIPNENVKQSVAYLEFNGLQDSIRYHLAKLAMKTNGFFSSTREGKIPKRATKDIMENGGALLTEVFAIPYFYKVDPLMEMQNIHIIPEMAGDYFACHVFTKNSPGTKYFNSVSQRALDNGLMNYWLYEHLPMRSVIKVRPPQVGNEPFKLEHLFAPFMLCSTGLCLAVLGFFTELTGTRFASRFQILKH